MRKPGKLHGRQPAAGPEEAATAFILGGQWPGEASPERLLAAARRFRRACRGGEETMTGVRGRRVLIVEDEFLIAQDLSRYFRKMGAHVLGPVSNVEAAGRQVDFAQAAVLDIDLNGQKVFPVADQLARRKVPFVFFSGRGDIALPDRFRHAGRLSKPVDVHAVFDALFPAADGARGADGPGDVLSILPRLRLSALLLMETPAAADRLVELTLESALASLDRKAQDDDLEGWLTGLLEETHRRYGRRLLL